MELVKILRDIIVTKGSRTDGPYWNSHMRRGFP